MKTSELIANARKKAGLKQKDVSDILGTSQQAYSQYERGLRIPKASTLRKIALALNVPLFALVGDDMKLTREDFSELTADDFQAAPLPGLPDPDREQLLSLFEKLNQDGRRRALEYLEDLTGMDKYTE